jgi:hypothetical protein
VSNDYRDEPYRVLNILLHILGVLYSFFTSSTTFL